MVFGLLRSNSTKSHVPELFKVFHFLHIPTLIHQFNPLNTELNPICHLLALLGAHHILHIGRIRVNILMKKLNYNLILDSINLCKNFEIST